MSFLRQAYRYIVGDVAYDCRNHWVSQSGEPGLQAVMFGCEAYNRLADEAEKREILRRFGEVSGKRVLDLGCGIGRLSKFLGEQGAQVVGIDLEFMIKRALVENASENVSYQAADILGMDFPAASFDLILDVAVLPLITTTDDELGLVFSKVARFLKPGGRFLSISPFHRYIFRRPYHESTEQAIELGRESGLAPVTRGGVLSLPARVVADVLHRLGKDRGVLVERVFGFGEYLLKVPILDNWLSDYKVLLFEKAVADA